MSNSKTHILLVEDNRLISFSLQKELQVAGHEVTLAGCGKDALAEVERKKPDVILMDVNLGEELDGVEIMQMIHAQHGFIEHIFLTGYAEAEVSARVDSDEPVRVIEKPVNIPVILGLLAELLADPQPRG